MRVVVVVAGQKTEVERPDLDTITDFVVSAGATLADGTLADVLTHTVLASSTYQWEALLLYTGPTADDTSFKVTAPASSTGSFIASGLDASLATKIVSGAYGTAYTFGANGTTVTALHLTGLVTVDVTAGSLAIQAAKAADASTDGAIVAGSYFKVRKIA